MVLPKRNGEKRMGKLQKKYGRGVLRENIQIYLLMLPTLALIFIFCYAPMYGLVIAFQDYFPGMPFLGEGTAWVGLKWFEKFVTNIYFGRLLKNTLRLSLLNIIFGFTAPIIFALLLEEIKHMKFKKYVQTASYLPYFISWVVVAGMVITFVDKDGLITKLLTLFGLEAQNYRLKSGAFPWIYTFTNVWKSFGFGSILYCSTISAIDPGLYEAAELDGANRWHKVWHVTLPGLKAVIAINLIRTIGDVLAANTDLILLFYTPSTYDTADVFGTYVYRLGLLDGQYSFSTAIGLFSSVVGITLTFCANKISNKLADVGLW